MHDHKSTYRKNHYELPADYLVPKAMADDSDDEAKPRKKNKMKTSLNDLHNENVEGGKEAGNEVKNQTSK